MDNFNKLIDAIMETVEKSQVHTSKPVFLDQIFMSEVPFRSPNFTYFNLKERLIKLKFQ